MVLFLMLQVSWLVTWTENIQNQNKYIMLNAASKIKVRTASCTESHVHRPSSEQIPAEKRTFQCLRTTSKLGLGVLYEVSSTGRDA